MAQRVEIVATGRDAGASRMLGGLQEHVRGLGTGTTAAAGRFSAARNGLRAAAAGAAAFARSLATLPALLAAAGMGSAVRSALSYADSIDEASEKTGIARRELQGLALQATVSKTSFDTVTKALAVMSRNALTASEGENEMSRAFTSLGVNLLDSNGKLRNQYDLLRDAADGFASIESATERAGLAQRIFGRGGQGILVMLGQGSEAMAKYQAEAEKLGLIMSDEQIKNVAAFNDSMATMGLQAKSVLGAMAGDIVPALNDGLRELMATVAQLKASGVLDLLATLIKGGLKLTGAGVSVASAMPTAKLAKFNSDIAVPTGFNPRAANEDELAAFRARQGKPAPEKKIYIEKVFVQADSPEQFADFMDRSTGAMQQ